MSGARTVFVVIGEEGMYSDRSTWVARVFEERADAEAFAERLYEVSQKAQRELSDLLDNEECGEVAYTRRKAEIFARLHALDPNTKAPGITAPSYGVAEVLMGLLTEEECAPHPAQAEVVGS